MKKFLFTLLIIVFSIYFLVEFIGDRLIKNILQENISSTLNRDVSIEKLNINYLSGEASGKDISLLNKKFDGYLLKIDSIVVDLDAFSIFSNDIIINNVLLENIKVNYFFNFSEQIISDNVRSLKEDLENKNTYSKSNKYFNIKNLDAKNISLSASSPNLNIEKTIRLDDMNFNNIGNTSESKDYKDILKDVFIDTTEIIKEKIFNENFLERLENFDPNQLEDKVKDKLKNKLKKLIN
jgi:hypothetical protein|tara:strand:+ start:786 stop:1499 length:714 start_codon:yes stop_codon:yes gene_type:complete